MIAFALPFDLSDCLPFGGNQGSSPPVNRSPQASFDDGIPSRSRLHHGNSGGGGSPRSVKNPFSPGKLAKASEIANWADSQGWIKSQTPNGPIKYTDQNGVVRVTIKKGSPRAPGSSGPHVELRDATGQRVDPQGNPVTRKSLGNHTPIDYDL